MDLAFTPEEQAFREEVRTWVQANLPKEISHKVHNALRLTRDDMQGWAKILGKKGWLAFGWPKEFGGPGWTAVQKHLFEEECALAGAPRIIPFGPVMVAPVIMAFGNAEQQKRFLPGIASGEVWWSQGYSEPGSGSDLASVKTRAERVGDKYIVNGQKTWTTLGQHGDWMFNLVRTSTEGKPQTGISFLLVAAEDALTTAITFSAMIAIMFIGIGLQKKREVVAKRLSVKYGKLWVAAEVFLFVLVGATVNIGYLGKVGAKALLLIVGALAFRMLGVFVCLLGTSLSKKERLFAMMAYAPKATVQAAIGGIPLALGFACGDTVLTVAVLAIVLTAPLGAFAMDLSYKKLLKKG
jgi:hypothetical protein